MMTKDIANYSTEELFAGDEFAFEQEITEAMVDAFSEVTGDFSPLHMHNDFACEKKFDGRVVHGMFLGGLLSRMVGMHCPGKSALLHSMQLKFISPAYIGDTVRVRAIVDHVSTESQVMIFKAVIHRLSDGELLCRSKIQVGFTQ